MGKFQILAKTLLKNLSKYDTVYKQLTGNNSDPLFPTTTETQTPITCYFKTPTNGDISSGVATASDVMIMVSGADLSGITPKQNDIIDGYTVKKIISLKESNNETALFTFVCEKR